MLSFFINLEKVSFAYLEKSSVDCRPNLNTKTIISLSATNTWHLKVEFIFILGNIGGGSTWTLAQLTSSSPINLLL